MLVQTVVVATRHSFQFLSDHMDFPCGRRVNFTVEGSIKMIFTESRGNTLSRPVFKSVSTELRVRHKIRANDLTNSNFIQLF